jgi:hypothetical protein
LPAGWRTCNWQARQAGRENARNKKTGALADAGRLCRLNDAAS